MKLTDAQLKQFDEEGYLFMPSLFTPEEVAVLNTAAAEIYATDREEVWRETSGVARTAFAAHTYNEAHRRLGAHPRLINPVEQVMAGIWEDVLGVEHSVGARWKGIPRPDEEGEIERPS